MAHPNSISSERLPVILALLAGLLPCASVTALVAREHESEPILAVETPLEDNPLSLVRFAGTEELSRLFRYDLEMRSDLHAIAAVDILGSNVTFGVRGDGTVRVFNGFVSRFTAGGEDESGRRSYRAEVVPWLWFLTRTRDSRVFQERSVPEIVRQVGEEFGFADLRIDLVRDYPRRDCVVQYRETAFDFLSRLMEHEGIFYYFVHEEGRHVMVLADSMSNLQASAGCASLPYVPPGSDGPEVPANRITSWEHRYAFTSGRFTQKDYDFRKPHANLLTTESSRVVLPGSARFEIYEYPGLYMDRQDGQELTRVRMEEEDAGHDVATGAGTCHGLSPGHVFLLGGHSSPREDGEYVITSVEHRAREPGSFEPGEGDPDAYSNTFTCIPAGVPFRPRRVTSEPIIPGVQTAVVVGPRGQEIYTDRYGRVKVQFHWDRDGRSDESSSCWVRVAQDWTRPHVSPALVPRVGQEVVVSFLEGNPDRPLVIGRVFNADDGVFTGADARTFPRTRRHRRR